MAKIRAIQSIEKPDNVAERNIRLTGILMGYFIEKPSLFDALPDEFELVILPEDDPEMSLYNLQLLNRYGSEGKSVVLARIATSRATGMGELKPSLYVPVTA